jgi:eukaryotic-like serine/threonine-protein kinase
VTSPVPPNTQNGAPQQGEKKTRKLGDYELLGKLGQGAMGSVYLANQISQNRKVALKILPQDLAKDQEFLERFRREARTATKLSHPNIVAAYDIGMVDNYNYIAMEYIDGPNLEMVLTKKGVFNEEKLLKIALDMCAALDVAENHGVVHRDIKPANILMNSQGVCKLTDLGLASASQGDQRVTMAGFAVGTPYYISPEQARGDLDVDGRADIYSLGATLYHLATGKVPFEGNNPVVIMTKHLQEMPMPASQRNPAVSQRITVLIEKMMAKDPNDRPLTAKDLREDIERCMRGELPTAKVARVKAVKVPVSRVSNSFAALPSGNRSSGDKLLGLIDKILFFVPAEFRVPLAAGGLTLTLLIVLYTLLKK